MASACRFAIYKEFGPGLLESVYVAALAVELKKEKHRKLNKIAQELSETDSSNINKKKREMYKTIRDLKDKL